MSTNKLRHAIEQVVTETFGRDVWIPTPVTARLKNGTRVIRVIGSSPYHHQHWRARSHAADQCRRLEWSIRCASSSMPR
jgi:hypothetical protein